MKRVFSLILAVVMVALMIPFAAIVTSATDDDSSEIILPENWRMTADDGTGVVNSQNELGVTLGSAGQYVQMTTKEGMGIGQKRVLAIDFGIPTKVNILRVSWEPTAETAQEYSWHSGSDIDFVFQCGPTQELSENAFSCIKFCTGTGYTWNNSTIDGQNRKTDFTVTKLVDGERVTTTSAGQSSWYARNNTDADLVAMDGAMNGNGSKMVFYFEIDENNKITYVHQVYTYHDAEGNFVSETVLTNRVNLDNVVVCDGYLTIGHNGWGDNTSIAVKSVDVYAGTYAEMGESLYSAKFAAKGEETLYAVDFSKINCDEELEMAGWNSINKSGVEFDAVSYVDGGIKYAFNSNNNIMLSAVQFDADRNYVVEYSFKWNTDAWVAINHFEHKDTTTYIDPATAPNSNGIKFRSNATTSKGYGFDTHSYYADAALTQALTGPSEADKKAMDEGATVTFKIIIEKGVSNVVEMTVGETTYYLKAKSARPVADGGMFGFAHVGGASAARYIILENFAVYDTTYYENTPDAFKAQVVLNGISVFVDGGETVDMSALPGAVAVKVDEAYVAPTEMTLTAGETYEVLSNFDLAADTDLAKGEASLRVVEEENGIRFTSKFDAADLQLLVDLYDKDLIKKVEVGTLITTSAWADAAGAVTFEALDAIKGDKTAYVEVMATVGDWYAENTFAGTISNVSAEREYQAAGFIKITLANDEVVFVYSAVNAATLASVTPEA